MSANVSPLESFKAFNWLLKCQCSPEENQRAPVKPIGEGGWGSSLQTEQCKWVAGSKRSAWTSSSRSTAAEAPGLLCWSETARAQGCPALESPKPLFSHPLFHESLPPAASTAMGNHDKSNLKSRDVPQQTLVHFKPELSLYIWCLISRNL